LLSIILAVYAVSLSFILILLALLWFGLTNTSLIAMVARSPLGDYLEQLASGFEGARAKNTAALIPEQ
jgi:hypothetical protein